MSNNLPRSSKEPKMKKAATGTSTSSKSLATTAPAQEDELSDSETHPEYIRALNDIQGVRDAKRKKLQIRRDCELRSLHEWHKVQCKQAWDAYNDACKAFRSELKQKIEQKLAQLDKELAEMEELETSKDDLNRHFEG